MCLQRYFLQSFLVITDTLKIQGKSPFECCMEKTFYSQYARRNFWLPASIFGELRLQASSVCSFPSSSTAFHQRPPLNARSLSYMCSTEFQNWNVCSSLPHINSIPLSHGVVIHAECTLCLLPVLLGMQRQHWNQCKPSSETTLKASLYWKWCLMRSLFTKNISKPNGKCMEDSCNKVFLSIVRKMNYDSLLYARNIFFS